MPQNIQHELHSLYRKHKAEIRRRLEEFKCVDRRDYFYELVYCLLTPQTSARNAAAAVDRLKISDFQNRDIDPAPLLHDVTYYIRFHLTKAKRVHELKVRMDRVFEILDNESLNAFDKREGLADSVKGLGLKEATHFLRNIGKNEGLAILDRHILRNLHRFGVIEEIPRSLSSVKYYTIEKEFAAFARACGISLDELDLLFWSFETGVILK
jgi:N-glycosylase/DNA lyase